MCTLLRIERDVVFAVLLDNVRKNEYKKIASNEASIYENRNRRGIQTTILLTSKSNFEENIRRNLIFSAN